VTAAITTKVIRPAGVQDSKNCQPPLLVN